MFISNFDLGYDPRRHPHDARWVAFKTFIVTLALMMLALVVFAPIHPFDRELGLSETWDAFGGRTADRQLMLRLVIAAGVAAIGALVAYWETWKHTPLSEPFLQVKESDPHVHYGEYARRDLQRRLYDEPGATASPGLYLSPHLALPMSAETKNILIVGEPNSGKSNIMRALVDQAIARGDRVLLLCNKGDVTASFGRDEAILIAAHHHHSSALDLAGDHDDVASAMQLAADIVAESQPPFWSDAARTVLLDIILALNRTSPRKWTAGRLLRATLSDTDVIRSAIAKIDLSASPLLESSDPDSDDKTVVGILLTLRTAAYANLRPLAWAWDQMPDGRRFSVKAWMSDDYKGPKTVILQYSPEYGALSSLVAGNVICRIARRLADPQLENDPKRRVVISLDEFHILDKIENLKDALAVGREKGLVVLVGIQNPGQLIEKYGENGGKVLLDSFGIKIYGRLSPGSSAEMISEGLGKRDVSALVKNRTPGKDDTRKYVEERKSIPTFSITQLASELGVRANGKESGDVRAIVHCFGQCYFLEWPFTLWRRKRKGFIPASWLQKPPTVDKL